MSSFPSFNDAPFGYHPAGSVGGAGTVGYTMNYDIWVKTPGSSGVPPRFRKATINVLQKNQERFRDATPKIRCPDADMDKWWCQEEGSEGWASPKKTLVMRTNCNFQPINNVPQNIPNENYPLGNFCAQVADSADYTWTINFPYQIPPGWRLSKFYISAGADDYIYYIRFLTTSGSPYVLGHIPGTANSFGESINGGASTCNYLTTDQGSNYKWAVIGTRNMMPPAPNYAPYSGSNSSIAIYAIGGNFPYTPENLNLFYPKFERGIVGLQVRAKKERCRDCEFSISNGGGDYNIEDSSPIVMEWTSDEVFDFG